MPVHESTIVIISTRDLVEQAKVIAEQSKITITFPSAIRRVAERAIQARKRFLKWFQQARAEDEEVNKSHEHFIGMLETILDLLKLCYESGKTNNGQCIDTKPKVKETLHIPTNIFDILNMEDITDEDISAPNIKPRISKSTTKSAPVEIYELDMDPEIDVPFIVFCFFEDVHRIQDFAKDTWTSHKNGDLDISTAYLLTNYAWRILENNVGDSYIELLRKSAMAKAVIRYTSPGTMEYDTTREDFIEIWQDIHNSIEHNPIPSMKHTWLSTIHDREVDETVEALAWNIYSMQRKEVKVEVSRMDQQFQPSPKLPKDHISCAAEIGIMEIIKSKNLSTKWIRHSTDPKYFLRQNPMCTGLRTLRLKLSLERAGLEFVLSNGTSFSISHIYNAGQQMNYIKGKGAGLDKFIDANLHDIFMGGRPKTTHEFYNVSKLLEQAHLPMGDMNLEGFTIARSMFRLRELALASQKLPATQTKKLSVHHCTPIRILNELRDFLPGKMQNMDIDYATVTRKCDILMAHINLTLARYGFVTPIMPHKE
ncbi:hypothetical protein OCU04_008544 [Sclerotinia nivalis]|uniref:DUF6604 domain-containing protein n=1 Tax=Sclerotinia nivalis TaxID=352851 RepID=A0A9X0AI97_9HELO|nr:hypothetical protein OCU04_008544 [Sclerotinia nivalis]